MQKELVLRGPLWTLHRLARNELGTSVLSRVMAHAFFPRQWLAGEIRFRLLAIAIPAGIIFGLLKAIGPALDASWAGWAWILVVGLASLLIRDGKVSFAGVKPTDPALGFRAFELFIWNLADAVRS